MWRRPRRRPCRTAAGVACRWQLLSAAPVSWGPTPHEPAPPAQIAPPTAPASTTSTSIHLHRPSALFCQATGYLCHLHFCVTPSRERIWRCFAPSAANKIPARQPQQRASSCRWTAARLRKPKPAAGLADKKSLTSSLARPWRCRARAMACAAPRRSCDARIESCISCSPCSPTRVTPCQASAARARMQTPPLCREATHPVLHAQERRPRHHAAKQRTRPSRTVERSQRIHTFQGDRVRTVFRFQPTIVLILFLIPSALFHLLYDDEFGDYHF